MVRINEDTCEKSKCATCVFHSSFDKMMPSGLGLLDMICANMLIKRHAALVFIAQGAATEKHYWEYIQWFWLDPLKVMLFLFWPLSLKSLPQILQLYGGVIPNCFCVPRAKAASIFSTECHLMRVHCGRDGAIKPAQCRHVQCGPLWWLEALMGWMLVTVGGVVGM